MTEPIVTPFSIEYEIAMSDLFSSRVAIGCVHVAREMYLANAAGTNPQEQHRKNFAISIIGDRPVNFKQYSALVITDPDTRALNVTGDDDPRLTDELILNVLRLALTAITEI